MIRYFTVVAVALLAFTGIGKAEELKVGITSEMQSVTVETADGPVEIRRIQDQEHEITGEFARTSRACPPFCIQPISPAEGVTTIGEVELIGMLKDPEAIVVDSRTVDVHIGRLRKALVRHGGDDPLRTVRGAGYSLG